MAQQTIDTLFARAQALRDAGNHAAAAQLEQVALNAGTR